jgi:creatinine amidohydrolase
LGDGPTQRRLQRARRSRDALLAQRGPATLDAPDPHRAPAEHNAEQQARESRRRAHLVSWPGRANRQRDRRQPRETREHGPHARIAAEPFGCRETRETTGDYDVSLPLHLSGLSPDAVRAALARDARLLVPVGTCEQHGPHLPLGCDTMIVERQVDDLSAEFGILRAPTVAYGVNTATKRPYPGNAAVRRKTLHRWMNDLLGAWEQGGMDAFIILTAHGHDPHQEALSTLRTRRARVFTVDIFSLDFTGYLEDPTGPTHGGELDTSLMLHIAPQLVRMDLAQDFLLTERQIARFRRRAAGSVPALSPGSMGRPSLASAAKGAALYKMIHDRIATRVLGALAA